MSVCFLPLSIKPSEEAELSKQRSYFIVFKQHRHISSSYCSSSKGQAWMEKSLSLWSLEDQASGGSTIYTGSYSVAQVSLKLAEVLQSQPPKCLDYKCETAHPCMPSSYQDGFAAPGQTRKSILWASNPSTSGGGGRRTWILEPASATYHV